MNIYFVVLFFNCIFATVMNEKLKPKNNNGGKSISGFAAMLRGEETPTVQPQPSEKPVEEPKRTNVETSISKDVEEPVSRKKAESPFDSLLEEIKERDYNCKSSLYLDDEVKEVFQMLKTKGKIPIAGLVSFILEEWLKGHQEEIKELLGGRKNRFM